MSNQNMPSALDIKWRYEAYREQECQQGRDGVTPVTPGEFDRWRQDEIRKAKAEGWEEGQKSGLRYADRAIRAHDMGRPDLPGPPSTNPYRDHIEEDQ